MTTARFVGSKGARPAWVQALAEAPMGHRARGLGTLRALAFDGAGERLASAGSVGVVVWAVDEGRVLARVAEAIAPAVAVAFAGDGSRIAALGRGGSLAIADLDRPEREVLLDLGADFEDGAALIWSPAGDALLVDAGPQAWRIVDGRAERLVGDQGALGADVRVIGFSSRGELVVLEDALVALLGPDLRRRRTLEVAAEPRPAVVRGDGRFLLAPPAGSRARLEILSLETGHVVAELRTRELHRVVAAARAPLAILELGARPRLVTYPSRRGAAARQPPAVKPAALGRGDLRALSADGRRLAVDAEDAIVLHRLGAAGPPRQLLGHLPDTNSAAALHGLDDAGTTALILGLDADDRYRRWGQLWDLAEDRPGPRLAADLGQNLATAAWLPGTDVIAAPAIGGGVLLFDRRDGRVLRRLEEEVDVHWVSGGRDGAIVAGGGHHGPLVLWERERGRVLARVDAPCRGLAWQPGGDLLALSGEGGALLLWSATGLLAGARRPAARVKIGGRLGDVVFTGDGSRCAVVTRKGGACIVDVAAAAVLTRVGGDAAEIGALAFRPGDGALLTGHVDGRVRIWDGSSGAPLGELVYDHRADPYTPGAGISGIAFAAGGRLLALSHASGALRLWDLPAP